MNISAAQTEYYRRPADERYASPESLVQFSQARKAACREVSYNAKDLRILPIADNGTIGRVQLASPKGVAELTPWSHGQLCRMVGAPAAYIRSLPATVAADALNYGLRTTAAGSTAVILGQLGDAGVTARAITSESYGRLYDADLLAPIVNTLGQHGWTTPPTWDGTPGGAYASDRDSFLLLCKGGSIVNDPSVRSGNGQMYRALMVRNSEVGAAAAVIQRVLYQFVCGNHMLWGAIIDKTYRRRHVGSKVLRDVLREVGTIARTWIDRPASADETIIRHLLDTEVAHTREACIDELMAMGATRVQATEAYATCEQSFDASPRSFWGLSQGLTRSSQTAGYQDQRLEMDQLAAALLRKGTRSLVAA